MSTTQFQDYLKLQNDYFRIFNGLVGSIAGLEQSPEFIEAWVAAHVTEETGPMLTRLVNQLEGYEQSLVILRRIIGRSQVNTARG